MPAGPVCAVCGWKGRDQAGADASTASRQLNGHLRQSRCAQGETLTPCRASGCNVWMRLALQTIHETHFHPELLAGTTVLNAAADLICSQSASQSTQQQIPGHGPIDNGFDYIADDCPAVPPLAADTPNAVASTDAAQNAKRHRTETPVYQLAQALRDAKAAALITSNHIWKTAALLSAGFER